MDGSVAWEPNGSIRPGDEGTVRSKANGSRFEWQTWAVAGLVYGGWLAITWFHDALPLPILIAAGAYIVALQTSLQHETIHGHPTGTSWINTAVGYAPLALFLPYERYRSAHLKHHEAPLTDPLYDPESNYIQPGVWRRAAPWQRWVYRLNATLAGRIIVGPAVWIARLLAEDTRRCLAGDREALRIWSLHLLAVAGVLTWVGYVCGLNPLLYVLGIAYPALALTSLRSFAEHRPADEQAHRTAIVLTNAVMRFLYLGNTYHVVHHLLPGEPWYRMGLLYRSNAACFQRANGGYVIQGYRSLWRSHALHPHYAAPFHPAHGEETVAHRGGTQTGIHITGGGRIADQ